MAVRTMSQLVVFFTGVKSAALLLFLSSCVPPELNSASKGINGTQSSLVLSAAVYSETKVRLSWDPGIGEYSAYQFFHVYGPTEVPFTSAGATDREIVVDVGEVPGNTLTFKVRATKPGLEGTLGDSATAQIKMPHLTVAWQLVTAAGPSPESTTKILHLDDLEADEAFVHLRWKQTSGSTIAFWKLFRSETPTGTSIQSEPIYSGTDSNYLDKDEMTSGKRYYYLVAGYDSQSTLVTLTKETYTRVPPEHQALVHRESANFEMCELLASPIDPKNFNRCVFSGLGSDGNGFYDFGKLLFVDRYELGVNVSNPAGGCGPAGNKVDCRKLPYLRYTGASIATYLNDNSVFNAGDVTYQAGPYSATHVLAKIPDPHVPGTFCMTELNVGFMTCRRANNTTFNLSPFELDMANGVPGSYNKLVTNAPKKPVVSQYELTASYANLGACSQRSNPSFGPTRIPRRSEQVVYSSWGAPGERFQSSSLTPSMLEAGTDHLYSGACNTNLVGSYAHPGLGRNTNTPPYRKGEALQGTHTWPQGDMTRTDSDELTPAGYALGNPAVFNSHTLTVVSGSSLTRNCVSRYGVQDHVGNMNELVDLSFTPISADNAMGTNEAMLYKTDGIMAPGGSAIAINGTTRSRSCVHLTQNPAVGGGGAPFTHFLPTLGLPYLDASHGARPIGSMGIGLSALGSDSVCIMPNYNVGQNQGPIYSATGGDSTHNQYANHLGGMSGINPPGGVDAQHFHNQAYINGKGRWTLYYVGSISGSASSLIGSAIRCVTEDN